MTEPEFYKVNLNGKLEELKASSKSLHHQRSILVKDHTNKKIWILNGSKINKKLGSISEKESEKFAKELGYEIVISSDIKEDVKFILDNKVNKVSVETNETSKKNAKGKSKKKNESQPTKIPITPKIPKIDKNEHILLGDLDHKGPTIEEFQIQYFDDEDINTGDFFKYGVEVLQQFQFYAERKIGKSELITRINKILEIIP